MDTWTAQNGSLYRSGLHVGSVHGFDPTKEIVAMLNFAEAAKGWMEKHKNEFKDNPHDPTDEYMRDRDRILSLYPAEKPQPTLDPQDAQKLEECKAKLTEIETAIREIEKKVKK